MYSSVDLIKAIFRALPFVAFIIGLTLLAIKSHKRGYTRIEEIQPSLGNIFIIVFGTMVFSFLGVYIISTVSSKNFNELKSASIQPVHATVETDGLYPGCIINLENGKKYKTRVENQELLTTLLDDGALLGKRENSNDLYLYFNNDTVCIPIMYRIKYINFRHHK